MDETKTTIVATAAAGTVPEMGLSLEFLPFHRLYGNNTRFSSLLRPSQSLKVDLFEYRSTSTLRGKFISAI